MEFRIGKIVSGGQTGVDQGALQTALNLGLEIGGFCPAGRLCETGKIPKRFSLVETESTDYSERTEKNVIHSDGTLILTRFEKLQGGTRLTEVFTRKHKKPCLVMDINNPVENKIFSAWVQKFQIQTLNIAGPRESKCLGIQDQTFHYLLALFKTYP